MQEPSPNPLLHRTEHPFFCGGDGGGEGEWMGCDLSRHFFWQELFFILRRSGWGHFVGDQDWSLLAFITGRDI